MNNYLSVSDLEKQKSYDFTLSQILDNIVSIYSGEEEEDKKEKNNQLVQLKSNMNSEEPKELMDITKRVGMTSASIRFLKAEKVKQILAIRTMLKDLEKIVNAKKMDPGMKNLLRNISRYPSVISLKQV